MINHKDNIAKYDISQSYWGINDGSMPQVSACLCISSNDLGGFSIP
jgi:hypothetical protein